MVPAGQQRHQQHMGGGMRGLAVGGKRLARERSGGQEEYNRQNQIESKRPKVSILYSFKINLSIAFVGEREQRQRQE